MTITFWVLSIPTEKLLINFRYSTESSKAFHSTFRIAKKVLFDYYQRGTKMKQLIVFLTFLSFGVYATPTDSECDCVPDGLPIQAEIRNLASVSEHAQEQSIRNLTHELCLELASTVTQGYDNLSTNIESKILKYSGISKDDPAYKLRLASFWNDNSSKIVCPASIGLYPRQHFFDRALEMNIQKFVLENYFFEDESVFPIDANILHDHPNGSKYTTLDYIDSMIARPDASEHYNIGQVRGLRSILVEFYGAKNAADL